MKDEEIQGNVEPVEETTAPVENNTEEAPTAAEVVEEAKAEGVLVDENEAVSGETTETAPAVEEETMEEAEEPSLISKYFSGIEVTDENREVLQNAAERLSKFEAVNREFMAIFNAYPEVGQALLDVREGADFHQAYRRYVDVESLEPLEDGEYKKGWDEARKTRETRLAEKEKMMAEAEKARENSIQVLKDYRESENLSDEEFNKLVQFTLTTIDAVVTGGLTVANVRNMHRLMNYDSDMEAKEAEALEVGKVQGRNEKIVSKKEDEKEQKGSGLPDMSSGADVNDSQKTKSFASKYFEDVLD